MHIDEAMWSQPWMADYVQRLSVRLREWGLLIVEMAQRVQTLTVEDGSDGAHLGQPCEMQCSGGG